TNDTLTEGNSCPQALAQRERNPYHDFGHRGFRLRGQTSRARSWFVQLYAGQNGARGLALSGVADFHHCGWRLGCQLDRRPADRERSHKVTNDVLEGFRKSADFFFEARQKPK